MFVVWVFCFVLGDWREVVCRMEVNFYLGIFGERVGRVGCVVIMGREEGGRARIWVKIGVGEYVCEVVFCSFFF